MLLISMMLVGCREYSFHEHPPNYHEGCLVTSATPLGPSDPGAVGRSAEDAVAELEGAWVVDLVQTHGGLQTASRSPSTSR